MIEYILNFTSFETQKMLIGQRFTLQRFLRKKSLMPNVYSEIIIQYREIFILPLPQLLSVSITKPSYAVYTGALKSNIIK